MQATYTDLQLEQSQTASAQTAQERVRWNYLFPHPYMPRHRLSLLHDAHSSTDHAPDVSAGPVRYIDAFRSSIARRARNNHVHTSYTPLLEALEERLPYAGIDWGDVPDDAPAGVIAELVPTDAKRTHAIAHSAHGIMATGSNDGMIRLYDTATGVPLHTLSEHSGKVVTALDFSPDGGTLASVSHDRTLRLWNTATGTLNRTVSLPYGASFVEFSADGHTLALSVDNLPCQLYDIETGSMRQIQTNTLAGMIDLSGDGTQVVYSHGGGISVADTQTLQQIRTFKGFKEYVTAAAFDPTRPFVAGGGNDGRLGIWNVDTGEQVFFERPHTGKPETLAGGIWSLKYSPDGRFLISGDQEGRMIVWDVHDIERGRYPREVARYQNSGSMYGIAPSLQSDAFFYASTASEHHSAVRVIPLPSLPSPAQADAAFSEDNDHPLLEKDALASAIAAHLQLTENQELYPPSALRIVSTQGVNVLYTVSSQFDGSHVSFEQPGPLGEQSVQHVGGTHVEFGQVTFDVTRPSGLYALHQYDRKGGRLLDTVWLRWDGDARTLHAADETDAHEQEVIAPLSPKEVEEFSLINSITDASLDHTQMNWAMSMYFVELTQQFDKEHDFWITTEEFMEYVYARHPLWHPDRIMEGIDLLWASMDQEHNTRGVADYAFNAERQDTLHRWNEDLERYAEGVRQVLHQAVDSLVRIRQGQDPTMLLEALDSVIFKWTNPNGWSQLQYYSRPVGQMINLGLPFPTHASALETARMILDKHWDVLIRSNEAMANYRAFADRQREAGLRETASGEWVAITSSQTAPPDTMTSKEIQVAQGIHSSLNSIQYATSSRITAIAADLVALETADHLVADAAISDIAFHFAQNVALLEEDSQYEAAIEDSQRSPLLWERADAVVRSQSIESISAYVLNLIPSASSRRETVVDGVRIRTDMRSGQLFVAFRDAAARIAQDADALAVLSTQVSLLTGIEAKQLYAKARLFQGATLTQKLVKLFAARGYTVEAGVPVPGTEHRGIEAALGYAPDHLAVHFTLGAEVKVDSFQVNIVRTPALQASYYETVRSMVVPNVHGLLQSAIIPTSALLGIPGNSAIKVVAWRNGQPVAWSVTEPIDLSQVDRYMGADWSGLSLANTPEQMIVDGQVFKLLAKNFPIRQKTDAVIWEYGSPFHTGNSARAVDLNIPPDDEGMPLYPIADNGVIEKIDPSYGTVTIRYDVQIAGQTIAVRTQYMHNNLRQVTTNTGETVYELLDKSQQRIGEIRVGQHVQKDTVVGAIGGKGGGKNDMFFPHLHLLITTTKQGVTTPVDLRKFFAEINESPPEPTTLRVQIMAEDTGISEDGKKVQTSRNAVTWNDTLRMFVNEQLRIIYDSSIEETNASADECKMYWRAWEKVGTMQQWTAVYSNGPNYYSADGRLWEPATQTFKPASGNT